MQTYSGQVVEGRNLNDCITLYYKFYNVIFYCTILTLYTASYSYWMNPTDTHLCIWDNIKVH